VGRLIRIGINAHPAELRTAIFSWGVAFWGDLWYNYCFNFGVSFVYWGYKVMKVFCLIVLVFAVLAGACVAANPQVTLHITGGVTGDIVLEFYPDKAPLTVENFINYVQDEFYDGLIFHRVIGEIIQDDIVLQNDFMIQGGAYDSNLVYKQPELLGQPGIPILNESANGLPNLRGTIAMARTSNSHSATTGFFINLVDNDFLNYHELVTYQDGSPSHYSDGYCVFGAVVSGMDVVDAIGDAVTNNNDLPIVNIVIESAEFSLVGPVCAEELVGDFDGDCDVDLVDFAKMAEFSFMGPVCAEELVGDLDGDCDVDLVDFAMMAGNWLECNAINGCE
jgi:cyclophilin family peptidyl-prolyl cis-trans isomerase